VLGGLAGILVGADPDSSRSSMGSTNALKAFAATISELRDVAGADHRGLAPRIIETYRCAYISVPTRPALLSWCWCFSGPAQAFLAKTRRGESMRAP